MSIWIIAIVGYAVIGIFVGRRARNRSMDKWYQIWYTRAKSHWGHESEVEQKKIGLANALSYNETDWITAGYLGFAFWPAFVMWYSIYFAITFIETHTKNILPKSKTEKLFDQIDREELFKQQQKQLEIDRKNLANLAKRMNLSTEGLESFEQFR